MRGFRLDESLLGRIIFRGRPDAYRVPLMKLLALRLRREPAADQNSWRPRGGHFGVEVLVGRRLNLVVQLRARRSQHLPLGKDDALIFHCFIIFHKVGDQSSATLDAKRRWRREE